jgi:TPR repeat protein
MKRSASKFILCISCVSLAHCGGGPQQRTLSASPQQAQQPATSNKAPASNQPADKPAAETSSRSTPAAAAVDVVMASGALQKCLGITPGTYRMVKPGKQPSCEQLPGAAIYNQAGERFQAGDHAGAAQIVTKAADVGNALAQGRLAMMYDQGDGVARSHKTAFAWYSKAAAQGEPESLAQLGMAYERAEGVEENWDLAARFYQASAEQGWFLGQVSYGRAYQFGIGVPQDRQQAIAWYQKASAQGEPNGKYWAEWLSNPTNNIGFRDDDERSIVMDVAGRLRFSGVLSGGDPYGVTFHSSAQRALWLAGQRQRADKDEAEVARKMAAANHAACVSAGRDDCVFVH